MAAFVVLELDEEQAREVHQSLVERQARSRVSRAQSRDAGIQRALDESITVNFGVARRLAESLGYARDELTEAKAEVARFDDPGDHHVYTAAG